MIITHETVKLLLEMYYEQEHGTDALGGTAELSLMALKFKAKTGQTVSPDEILSELIKLRKSGILKAREGLRHKTSKKETWREFDGNVFTVILPVKIGRPRMFNIVAHYFDTHETLPVTRQEVFDHLMTYNDCFCHDGDFADNTLIVDRLEQLFPELK